MEEVVDERIEDFVRTQYIKAYDESIDQSIENFVIDSENCIVTMFVSKLAGKGKFIGRKSRVIISVNQSLQEEFGDEWKIEIV